MTPAIAIVGIACRYPDATSPVELWENVLAQRQAFRRIPPERLNLADYFSSDRNASDRTYAQQAALIEGYEFDRVKFRVSGSTFRTADLVHWLALDIASQAIADAGFIDSQDLPKTTTGVILGNTLTGEFSRSNTMRLRWPYVRRVVENALIAANWTSQQRYLFLDNLQAQYKAPFPEIGTETLAGNLSNTIAGRICNHFDLQGGGYTVDGACSSSLLAVAQACTALTIGDLDVALAGGVDLSLDPFELVGFAKAGALAQEEMRVYDVRSAGFIPGEGCGFVVLMRYEDALAQKRRIYAVIRGWGISSDGSGGITRPEVAGQILALHQAYRRAQFGIETVSYFEGHGTGTGVGDTTELQALSLARHEEVKSEISPAVIGSIKANIGHTKAAAGIAGLIKAAIALHTQVLPPTTGCEQPHPELCGEQPALRVLNQGQIWHNNLPLRAGVSAMGFGGINTHIVLEGIATERRKTLSQQEDNLLRSVQDTELILMAAQDTDQLAQQVEHLLTLAPRLSRAEVTDLAAEMAKNLNNHGLVRAAIAVRNPQELTNRLEILKSWLKSGISDRLDIPNGVFLGLGKTAPRIGFLFPGQGSPVYLNGGAWCRRFAQVQELYEQIHLPITTDTRSTSIAQPSIVLASMSGLSVLDKLGITASIAVGHSLGELTALHWAGAFDRASLGRIATVRGLAMSQLGSATGTMASIRASFQQVNELLDNEKVVIAGLNSPQQTVISGEAVAVATIVAKATQQGVKAVNLPVSHAFHSPLVAAAAEPLAAHLSNEDFRNLQKSIVSTVTGTELATDIDVRSLLIEQITAPVKFLEAATKAAIDLNLWIEVGPGRVLSGLVSEFLDIPVISLDAGGSSLSGLLTAVGAAFVIGAEINHQALFSDRFTRAFNLNWQPKFFVNPCELQDSPTISDAEEQGDIQPCVPSSASTLDIVRQLVAQRAELPLTTVKDESRLLSDLHLNSITVGQLIIEAARNLSLPAPLAPTNYADASIGEVAQALEELLQTGAFQGIDTKERSPQGVDSWIQTFTVELRERPLPRRQFTSNLKAAWQVIADQSYPLTDALKVALQNFPGRGIVVCLPPEPDERHINLLLQGAKTVLAQTEVTHFVLVQHGGGGAAFARTLYLENPTIITCVVDVPLNHPQAIAWISSEILAANEYSEVYYNASGQRYEPRLQLLPNQQLPITSQPLKLGKEDVLLVTGGGKGIAAECALSLAKETGVSLALLGRSQPETDAELATNLKRMAAAGVRVQYIAVDISDASAVQIAVKRLEADIGAITAILHGAGVNVPKLLSSLEQKDFLHTLAPKVQGIYNILAAINPEQLKLLISFGSIIARTGLPGEADYGLANEWLARLIERFQIEHPHCRCLNLEWSIWSGVGMGERLGRIDALMQQGITPISPDVGIAILHRLIAQSLPTTSIVVTGRFGEAPTLKLEQPELPFLRFIEHQRVYYPGVELIVDVEISPDTDPYLDDHVFQGERLLPAVMGLEAIAQIAMALAESIEPPLFKDVNFHRPVVITDGLSTKIRLAAIVRSDGDIEVVLRSEQTNFSVDHFQATCCFDMETRDWGLGGKGGQKKQGEITKAQSPKPKAQSPSLISLNPDRDLYSGILFHRGRFQRLRGYRHLRATECVAEITSDAGITWFSSYLPKELVLGDPSARDAAIHALQACIPQATILPIGVERLLIFKTQTSGIRLLYAKERSHINDIFIYDLEVITDAGIVLERWEGLKLQMVKEQVAISTWAAPLLATYIERRIRELIHSTDMTVVVDQDPSVERRVRSDRAIQQALGSTLPIFRRPDGKPEITGGRAVSAAHTGDLTLAIAGTARLSCDVESIAPRSSEMWQGLLGKERYQLQQVIATAQKEDQDTAGTRVWAATECLQKAGAIIDTPLTLVSSTLDGWVVLIAGSFSIATLVTSVQGFESRLVLAVLSSKTI